VFSLLHLDASGRITRHEDHWSIADPLEASCLGSAYWAWRRFAGWLSSAAVRLAAGWLAAPVRRSRDPHSDVHEIELQLGMTSAQARKAKRRAAAAQQQAYARS